MINSGNDVEYGKLQLTIMDKLHDAGIIEDHQYYLWLVHAGYLLDLYSRSTELEHFQKVGAVYPEK